MLIETGALNKLKKGHVNENFDRRSKVITFLVKKHFEIFLKFCRKIGFGFLTLTNDIYF